MARHRNRLATVSCDWPTCTIFGTFSKVEYPASCGSFPGGLADHDFRSRRAILGKRPRHEFINGKHFRHTRRGMPGAPDVAPAFGTVFAGTDIDVLADVDGAARR